MATKKPGKKKKAAAAQSAKASGAARSAMTGAAKLAKAAARAKGPRRSWLDAKSNAPLIEDYARQLGTFMEAMADGVIEDGEVAEQEDRLVKLMKSVEPTLDDGQHEAVTRLLCELTAYNIMQMLNAMHAGRPKAAKFRG